jgi:hypothetical protein
MGFVVNTNNKLPRLRQQMDFKVVRKIERESSSKLRSWFIIGRKVSHPNN